LEAEWIEGYISTREFISCGAMETNEETLITDAAGGSSAALQRLFYLYHKRLLSYVTKHMPEELQQQAEPQDVLQDTFFEVTRRITDFKQDGDQAFFRWIATIARNRIIDLSRMARSLKRGGGRGQINDEETLVQLLEQLAVYSRTPSRSAAAHEFMASFESSLARLSELHQQAIRLRYIDGLSADQAAEKMRRSKGAFHMLCNRGLKALRIELQSASRFC